jgi:hypothetical protein
MGVTAKLNKIALYGVLVDLKKYIFVKKWIIFQTKKKTFVLIFFYARVIRKILLSR